MNDLTSLMLHFTFFISLKKDILWEVSFSKKKGFVCEVIFEVYFKF